MPWPGLYYIHKCMFFFSFYCLPLLTLVFQALLTPPGTHDVPSSPHAVPPPFVNTSTHCLLCQPPLFINAGHCACMPQLCKYFFFSLFCLRSLPPTSMPMCHGLTPHLASFGCINAPAFATHRCSGLCNMSLPLVLAVSMHLPYHRLDIIYY